MSTQVERIGLPTVQVGGFFEKHGGELIVERSAVLSLRRGLDGVREAGCGDDAPNAWMLQEILFHRRYDLLPVLLPADFALGTKGKPEDVPRRDSTEPLIHAGYIRGHRGVPVDEEQNLGRGQCVG